MCTNEYSITSLIDLFDPLTTKEKAPRKATTLPTYRMNGVQSEIFQEREEVFFPQKDSCNTPVLFTT
ncbi:MAG: hypothetical protein ABEI13_01910 [Candidatus Paceibacteria bacterium]